jgi:hypothetical protein
MAVNVRSRFLFLLVLFALVGCLKTGRSSIPRSESHYEQSVQHVLAQNIAVARVEAALAKSYTDLPKVLRNKSRKEGTFLLEPKVSYRTGGPMGAVHHAPYTLAIAVHEKTIDLVFDLQKDSASGEWAPSEAIPYIRHDFDAVVSNVEDAVAKP